MGYRNEFSLASVVDSTTVEGSIAATSTGNVTLISSGRGSIYVYAFDLAAQSTANVSIRLMSGSTAAECWRTTLGAQSTTAIAAGELEHATGAMPPPGYFFRTNPGDPLTYEKGTSSAANALISYALSFWRA